MVGPVRNFREPFLNSTLGLDEFGASALHNPSEQTVGYSAFYGFGFPITIAGTSTPTSVSDPDLLLPLTLW